MEAGASGPQRDEGHLSDLAKIQKDLLWGEYTELRNHTRHAETVRINAVNFVLLLTSALVAVVTLDKAINRADLALSVIITGIGLFSTGFSILYLDRYEKHRAEAMCVREELDRLFFGREGLSRSISALHTAADTRRATPAVTPAGRVKRKVIRLVTGVARDSHLFWIIMPVFVSITGIALTIISVAA